MTNPKPKYQRLAEQTQDLLQSSGRPGDRVLSIRDYASRENVSISTAQRVYELLELRGLLESRPRSGYYLSGAEPPRLCQLPKASLEIPVPENRAEWLNNEASAAWHEHNFNAYFASGMPDVSLAGVRTINRIMRQLTRNDSSEFHRYGPLRGDLSLRHQLVKRMAMAGVITDTEKLLVTSGGQEALHIALSVSTSPGDLVAVESPAYHGITSAIQQLGRRLIEIPTDPLSGMSLPSLQLALENLDVKAVVISTSAQNPLGFSMDDASRQGLVQLADEHDIALIEDDVYGELTYSRSRSRGLRAYDTQDRVMTCGSVSKTLSPGLRVGWLETGRWIEQATLQKRVSSMRTPMLGQLAVARHMEEGHYDRHLRLARTVYAQRAKHLQQAVREYFPVQCRVSRPRGGFMLWVELPADCSGIELANFAVSENIALSPGVLFSHQGHYTNCIRLCYSCYVKGEHEASVKVLGDWLQANPGCG